MSRSNAVPTTNKPTLHEYVQQHATRCEPGQEREGDVDVAFFHVRKSTEATVQAFLAAMREHEGAFCDLDPLDGQEHNFIKLGGWVGDQGTALLLMGLGEALGLWKVMTPKNVLGDFLTPALQREMAGLGYVSIKATHKEQRNDD